MPKRQQFLSTLRQHADAFAKKTGIPAEWALAMALNETGGDLSSPSLFGIKALPGQAGNTYNTWEVEGGQRIDQPANFRSYGNYGEAFDQLASNMTSNMYKDAPKTNAYDFASYLQSKNWASDPDYARKISRLATEVGGSAQGGKPMGVNGDPFAFVDFNQNPQRPAGQDPEPRLNMPADPGTGGPTTAMPSPGGPAGGLPPDISPGMDPEEAYTRANRYLNQLLVTPRTGPGGVTDPTWTSQVTAAQGMVNQALTAYNTTLAQKRADVVAAIKRDEELQGKYTDQRIADQSRSQNYANSIALTQIDHKLKQLDQEQAHQQDLAEIASRGDVDLARQRDQQGFLRSERTAGEEFDITKMGKTQDFTRSERLEGQEFQLGKLGKEQDFNARENAADREIRNTQNEIAAGNLNLSTALGKLKAWLDAVPYSLAAGAEYAPGYQPGGGVQEGARLAGVSYNPANYRANPVPFDPAAVVRQTMGR